MEDRVSRYPGRVLLTPEDGSAPFYATIMRADEPTQPGDPRNKNTLLKDETAAMFGLDPAATPDDVFKWLGEWGQSTWKLLARYDTAGEYTFTVPDDVDELGVFVLGAGSGGNVAVGSDDALFAVGGSSGGLTQMVLNKQNGDFVSGSIEPVVVGSGGSGAKQILGSYTGPVSGGTSSFGGIVSGSIGQKADEYGFGDYAAPYGLYSYLSSVSGLVSTSLTLNPLRGVSYAFSYKGRNVFDTSDLHVYCGAGGGVTKTNGQSVVARILGKAGAGTIRSTTNGTVAGDNATAPGDGGGALFCSTYYEERVSATAGSGADGLVLVYGRKVVSNDAV